LRKSKGDKKEITMDVTRTIKISLSALMRNKMRSFLTALGIIIGVGAVVATVSIGAGARADIEARFAAMGTNNLTIRSGSSQRGGVRGGSGSSDTLSIGDAYAIKEECPAVAHISPSVNTRAQIVYGNSNWNTRIYGGSESYIIINNWQMELGVFFDEDAVRTTQRVCVIGVDVRDNLFGENADPLDQNIRIGPQPFRVIGVLKSKGELGGWGSRDDMIVAPYTTVMKLIMGKNDQKLNQIDVAAASGTQTTQAQIQIEDLLRIRHNIFPGAEDDFYIRNMADVEESATQSTKIMTILLGAIAAISLLVGGIGIMNIMLVSVTERIREIGIRMSVGAKAKDILYQFLVEAIVLTVLGGIIGVAVGAGASFLIDKYTAMTTVITPISMVIAFTFAAIIGIFFGFYPARKASSLDPIEALRYE